MTVSLSYPESAKSNAILCVPAHRMGWESPARESGAWIMWDLEDGVPAEHKAEARRNLHMLARRGDLVRVNRGENPSVCRYGECIESVIVYPKVEIGCLPPPGRGIIIESPTAVRDVDNIIGACCPRVVLFGWADLLAGSGLTPASTSYLDWCRSRVVLSCRAAGVPVYDGPPLGDAGPAALRARAQGFDGMGCIHPRQVPAVEEAFSLRTEEEHEFLDGVAAFSESVPPPLSAITEVMNGR